MKKQLWTPARIKTLCAMWSAGKTRTAIATQLGCSNTAVRCQAAKLKLAPRDDSRPRSIKATPTPGMRGGIASTLKLREEDETRVVKLPVLTFQTRRFDWERA